MADKDVVKAGDRTVASNRKAHHEFDILETLEAGMVLMGSEIKSIRAGNVSLQEAHVAIDGGEAWLVNGYIAPYEWAGYAGHEPRRRRKLLLHRKQILQLHYRVMTKGVTLVPLRLYIKSGRAKLEIALARGRKLFDKRHAIRERETKRQTAREMNQRV